MSYTPDPRVAEFNDALPSWQQAGCAQMRTLVPDPENIKAGQENKTARTAFWEGGNINAPALTATFQPSIANNLSSWRSSKQREVL